MKNKPLSRRSFIHGALNTILYLPLLDIMLDEHGEILAATGEPLPKYYIVIYQGMALVHERYIYRPTKVGADYECTVPLRPLDFYGVKGDVNVITNLRIPHGGDPVNVQPGGIYPSAGAFHNLPLFTQVNGLKSTGTAPKNALAISADQIFLQKKYQLDVSASIHFNCQEHGFNQGSGAERNDLSYINGAPLRASIHSPKMAFSELTKFMSGKNSSDEARRLLQLKKEKSILDLLLKDETKALSRKLGAHDREKLEAHFAAIRTLESNINSTKNSCARPSWSIDTDPPKAQNYVNDAEGNIIWSETAGWNDEETRASQFCDLLHLSIACDYKRVGTMVLLAGQSETNAFPIQNIQRAQTYNKDFDTIYPGAGVARTYVHNLTHSGEYTYVVWDQNRHTQKAAYPASVHQWSVKHYAYLLKKLKDTPVAGGTLLDHTVVVLLNEAGWGPPINAPMTDAPVASPEAHSTDNMITLISGGVGGMKKGLHIDGEKAHPTEVLVAALNSLGVNDNAIGEVTLSQKMRTKLFP